MSSFVLLYSDKEVCHLIIYLVFCIRIKSVIVLLWDFCRYEWYQTETHVVVSVLVKNVKKEDLKCDIQQSSVIFF